MLYNIAALVHFTFCIVTKMKLVGTNVEKLFKLICIHFVCFSVVNYGQVNIFMAHITNSKH